MAFLPVDSITPAVLLEHEHGIYETVDNRCDGALIPMEVNAHLFEHMGGAEARMVARNISERKETERLKCEAFKQIEKNMEQFAILDDHLRNPPSGDRGSHPAASGR